jgi:hypothetical protein
LCCTAYTPGRTESVAEIDSLEDDISAAIQDFVMNGINANSHLGDHAGETS